MNKLVREIVIIIVCLFLGFAMSQYFLKEYRNEASISK